MSWDLGLRDTRSELRPLHLECGAVKRLLHPEANVGAPAFEASLQCLMMDSVPGFVWRLTTGPAKSRERLRPAGNRDVSGSFV